MMQRRDVLKGLLALGALAGLGRSSTMPVPDRMMGPRLLRVPVRGHRYHDGPRILGALAVGDPLQLVREPDNPYDDDAVAVHAGDARLGYLPREHNHVVAALLDQGTPLCTTLVELDENKEWAPCEVEVRLAV